MTPVSDLARALEEGRTTSQKLIAAALERIQDPAGEGARTFLKIHDEAARTAAEASDKMRAAGIVPSPLAGLPISVKDLFDVVGDVTTAGSVVLKDRPAAQADAIIVARLRAAGAIIIGRTNMTEFAYSGLGLNRHYDTPRNPWDRETGRIPGGSSSGAAVSVADDMAAAAIGTDTGGSVRIPSALCGLTGLKPTARRIPTAGCYPLSQSLDSIGPLAPTVACCALVDAVMAGNSPAVPPTLPIEGMRLAVWRNYVLDDLDDYVAARFAAVLAALSKAGARIIEIDFPGLLEIPEINKSGGVLGAEAYSIHRDLLANDDQRERYDPRVNVRIMRAIAMDAADYLAAVAARNDLIGRADAITAPFDAVVMPSVPEIAPPAEILDNDDGLYAEKNILMLRNPTVGNFLDRCALSLPCHVAGEAPAGVMVMGETMGDARLIAIGMAVEAAISPLRA